MRKIPTIWRKTIDAAYHAGSEAWNLEDCGLIRAIVYRGNDDLWRLYFIDQNIDIPTECAAELWDSWESLAELKACINGFFA